MAAMGKQLKQSVKVFQSLMLYLRLPAGDKGGLEVTLGTAWGWAGRGRAGGHRGRAGRHGREGRSSVWDSTGTTLGKGEPRDGSRV